MSDSSDNNELFGSDSNDENKEDEDLPGEAPPDYINGQEFTKFAT